MKKRVPVIAVCCLAAVGLGLFLFLQSQQDHFDQEQFDADLAVLRDYYSANREPIRLIADQMQAHPEIEGLQVHGQQGNFYISTTTGSFEELQATYPILYSLLQKLPSEQEHSFSRNDHEPQMVTYSTDPSLHIGRYRNGFWTTTYFCFCPPDSSPDSSFFYREELENGCWLVAQDYDME